MHLYEPIENKRLCHVRIETSRSERVGFLVPWSEEDVTPLLLAFGRAFRSRTI